MQAIFNIDHATETGASAYDFAAPMDVNALGSDDPFFAALVGTDVFQRLNSIRFLGGIDYLLIRNPNGAAGNVRYTRAQHSMGVARLALLYSKLVDLSGSDRRMIFAAALLHDAGHAPLSHSLEPVFFELFGVEHHQITLDIISGKLPFGRNVNAVLQQHNVDISRLIALLSGEDPSFDGFFSGPINFDTIEGILRTKIYVKRDAPLLPPELVVEAATLRATPAHRELVDTFWTYKDQVYRHVINSTVGILADHVCQLFMRKYASRISAADYLSTEDAIFRKLPGLRKLLTSADFEVNVPSYLDKSISFKARRFDIHKDGDFFGREDTKRYQQTRERRSMIAAAHAENQEYKKTGDLFRDYNE